MGDIYNYMKKTEAKLGDTAIPKILAKNKKMTVLDRKMYKKKKMALDKAIRG